MTATDATRSEVPLDAIASQVRSKNAGPFWQTVDIFFDDQDDYDNVVDSPALSAAAVARLYKVDEGAVRIFRMPTLHAVKISFPRRVVAGSFADRDLHAGQQHVPLASAMIARSRPSTG